MLCAVLAVLRFVFHPDYILTWDVFGYYLYLPAHFIYGDIGLVDASWLDQLVAQYEPTTTLYQLTEGSNGTRVIRYTCGLSILFAPFFFIGHWLAGPLGFPADGLSLPYQYSVTVAGLLYAFSGLYFFAKILRHFFNSNIAILILILTFFTTNYFHLTAFDGTLLSHNFLFTFYAILVYCTIRWYEQPKMKYAFWLGISLGFITLIRPSEAVCVLIPLLWLPKNSENYWKEKANLFVKNWRHILVVLFCAFLVISPQLIYWKKLTGEFLFYSYDNPGEGLDFLNPHTYPFLFSFRKGWFVYTPLMIFAMAGFYFLYKKHKAIAITIFIFFIVNLYIISSWTTWWYAGGSFSSRSLVPSYVLLAIPLGFLVQKIGTLSFPKKMVFAFIGLTLTVLNLFQTWQFEKGILSKQRMTRDYYFAIFGKTQVSEKDKKLMLIERPLESFPKFENQQDYTSKMLYENDFSKGLDTMNRKGILVMENQLPFSPGIDMTFNELTDKDHAWIQAEAGIFVDKNLNLENCILVATFHHKNKEYSFRAKSLDKDSLKLNEWNTLKLTYLTPEVRIKKDNLKVYIWYRGNDSILVDYLKVELWEPK